jgi:hypothetical protein
VRHVVQDREKSRQALRRSSLFRARGDRGAVRIGHVASGGRGSDVEHVDACRQTKIEFVLETAPRTGGTNKPFDVPIAIANFDVDSASLVIRSKKERRLTASAFPALDNVAGRRAASSAEPGHVSYLPTRMRTKIEQMFYLF